MILATAFSAGKTHDFRLFKRRRTALPKQTKCLADSGYLGLAKHHANSQTPHKGSKLHPLTKEQKAEKRSRRQKTGNWRGGGSWPSTSSGA